MYFLWDETKSRKLKETRDISIEEIAQIIFNEDYLAILENPSRPQQMMFIVMYHDYIHVVPFIINQEGTIILKTVYPSRKYHKLYAEKNDKTKEKTN